MSKTEVVAECWTCSTTYFENNAPNRKGPMPIYGPYGKRAHVGHDVRPVRKEGEA